MWNMKFVLIILTGLLFENNFHCQSHYGTEFIFGIPHNILDEKQCSDVYISIASQNIGTYFLRIPFLNISKTGSVLNITEIRLDCSIAKFGNFTEHRGLYLNTSTKVSVYATNYYKDTAESFLVLPVSGLGHHYGVAAYEPYAATGTRFIMVVATCNSTNGHISDGKSFNNFSLNPLDIYQFATFNDIQSMSVTSDKPVTVITGTSCANIPHDVSACDVIVEQMIPFQSLDKIYIAPPTPPKKAYDLKVTHVNNSVIDKVCFHNNSKNNCMHDSTFSIRMGITPTVISSSQTISVVQFGLGNGYPQTNIGDPFMTVIQGLRNFLNSYSFAIPNVYNNAVNHISITIPTMNLNGLVLDGSNLSLPQNNIFNVSAPLENYTIIILDVNVGYHNIYHVNKTVKFGLLVYGQGAATDKFVGFGYPAGMQLSLFDTLQLSTLSPDQSTISVNWTNSGSVSTFPVANGSALQANTSKKNDNFGNETSLKNEGEKSDRNTLGIALGAVFGSLAFLSFVGCLLLFFVKRKKIRKSSVQPETDVYSQSTKNLKNENCEPSSESVKTQDDETLKSGKL